MKPYLMKILAEWIILLLESLMYKNCTELIQICRNTTGLNTGVKIVLIRCLCCE